MLAIPHPYDPPRHTGLQQHLTVTIPSQSGPRPDLAATQPMAGADLITTPIPAPVDTGRLARKPTRRPGDWQRCCSEPTAMRSGSAGPWPLRREAVFMRLVDAANVVCRSQNPRA
jgi:hypothetical protein